MDVTYLHVDSEDTDQTRVYSPADMSFLETHSLIVWFLMLCLICFGWEKRKLCMLLQAPSLLKFFHAQLSWARFILLINVKMPLQARGYKTFFMLNSAEHEIYPAHKC